MSRAISARSSAKASAKARAGSSLPGQDPVWEALAEGARRTGTGPTRLVDWLPMDEPGPMLVREPRRSGASGLAARPWTWIESLVLAAYALVVALGLTWHEPWADEAQAWLLARDSGWWHMMLHGIRYEGSPGLWHSLLWVLVRLHVSFAGMHWVSAAVAAAGVWVLLRYSPFPLLLRILLPFGFWLAYQDAVVARSYVLFAVLAFTAAAMLRSWMHPGAYPKLPRLFGLAAVLGLMANISVHGFVASLGFALVALAVLRRKSRAGVPARWALPALVLCAFWIVAVATTLPTSDQSFIAGRNFEKSIARVEAIAGYHRAAADQTMNVTERNDVRPGELTPAGPDEHNWTARQALWHRIARVLALVTFPLSNFRILALLACVLALLQAWRRRERPGPVAVPVPSAAPAPLGWVGLLPWALMVLVFTSLYFSPRHAGMLWTAFLASLWLTWPTVPAATRRGQWLRHATVAALVLVAADQIWWTAHAVWADVHRPYSGDRAMAEFLRKEPPGTRIAGFYYFTVGPAAWFRHAIYFNQPHAYWLWSRNVRTTQQAPATIATHPDVIVVGRMQEGLRDGNISDDWVKPDPPSLSPFSLGDRYRIIPYAEAQGYRVTHSFCGHSFMRDGWAEELCQVALEPQR